MQMLSRFFPKHARPRAVVHAGPLVLRRSDGVRSLGRYLRIPRKREVFLVHHGHEALHEVAKQSGVPDITVEASVRKEADAATEMALALGAHQLDFTIDEPGIAGPDGRRLNEISIEQADSLARSPDMRPRIRAKLRAGAAALRNGMARVRLGDPAALTRDRATVVVPDPAQTRGAREGAPSRLRRRWSARREEPVPDAAAGARGPCADPPLTVARRDGRSGRGAPRNAIRFSPRAGHCEVIAPTVEPAGSLHDAWWRLRGHRSFQLCFPDLGSEGPPLAA